MRIRGTVRPLESRMIRNERMYVVLVGLGDYEHAPTLEGPPNDVRHMWELCVHHLGVPAHHIQVVVTGGEDPTWATDGTNVSRIGTRAQLERSMQTLSTLLDDDEAIGLIHFSGHGVRVDGAEPGEDIGVCATDASIDADGCLTSTHGVVSLDDLAQWFGTVEDQDDLPGSKLARLTLTFDCCWNDHRVTEPRPVAHRFFRMMVGASPGQVAREIELHGRTFGAFTWSLVTAMSRWQMRPVPGGSGLQLDASHGRLMDMTKALMDTLEVGTQVPDLVGPRVLDHLPVFHPRIGWESGWRPIPPNTVDRTRELTQDQVPVGYRLNWGTSIALNNEVATIMVPSTTSNGQEHWFITPMAKAWLEEVLLQPGHPSSKTLWIRSYQHANVPIDAIDAGIQLQSGYGSPQSVNAQSGPTTALFCAGHTTNPQAMLAIEVTKSGNQVTAITSVKWFAAGNHVQNGELDPAFGTGGVGAAWQFAPTVTGVLRESTAPRTVNWPLT